MICNLTSMEQKQYTIDATGKAVGRLATDVAMALMGKRLPSYRPHVVAHTVVHVTNLSKAHFTGTKLKKKKYFRFTGYETGVHEKRLGDLWEKKPEAVLMRIVSGMLPKNTLRTLMLKRLKVTL